MNGHLPSGRALALIATLCAGTALAVPASRAAQAGPAGHRAGVPAAVTATAAGTGAVPTGRGRVRGRLVGEPVHLRGLSRRQVQDTLRQARFSPRPARYGVDLYRLVYRTLDPRGRPTTASGLLVTPRNRSARPRLVSFTHGTQSYRDDAPSIGKDDFAVSPAVTFGSAGFAAVAPDYLGLGRGPGTHPWMDVPSETTASLDMLRAARSYLARRGRPPRRTVLVTGFSQGASAALGLARALQNGADRTFRLGAVAPISGGYDLRGAEIPAMLAGEQVPPKLAVAYTTYLLVAWNRLHHLYDAPEQVFRAPYAAKADGLFDGTTPGEAMLAALPDTLDRLLTPNGFRLLRHPSPAFARALAVADGTCTGWIPRVPVRLYVANGDEQAVTANTEHCRAAFRASGAHVRAVELGPHDYYGSRHLGSAVRGTAAVANWFARLSG